ncbi:hypothetical protein FOE78_07585 [Microlunatus elymi]|uniref:Extensin-like protein C-terminus n=1 Tax=Microlunatus elymi TaxID=2596828 RepID=A0A516PX85_9ACTN|nr:hypothetical protein [Microlunatus elymi]QDP95776.1 hypothetical protein FOE78_07585 [Microlunatus elymi]
MPLRRRTLLALGLGTIAAGVAGCSTGGGSSPSAYCVSTGQVGRHSRLGNARLVYDISGKPTSFRFDGGFYDQLVRWLSDYRELSGTKPPDQVWTYGSWLDGEPNCDSWHDAGRAFDLSRLVAGNEVLVSCRYDLWRNYTGARLQYFRSRYWALAASLHLHFAYVLTYLYNSTHHNHIHIDNGRSGDQLSTFSKRSPSQVQAVQGMLNHVWGQRVEISSDWNDETADATRSVLERTEHPGAVDDGTDQWRAFLRATAAHRPS